ncbi:ATP-binding protein [Candidatus Bipolaricaulota sp. J31]
MAGKGGVGKTTLVALLARAAVDRGYRVLAVDADPNPTLASTLGYERPIRTLIEYEELISERAGSRGLVKLNPTVDDIPDRFAVEHRGIRILVLGGIRGGGTGCACPANSFLRALLRHLVLRPGETVIVDLEAGVEHLGRATAQGVDTMLVVVEPDRRSLETAARIRGLAEEIGLVRVYAVGNKLRDEDDREFVRAHLPRGLPLLAALPFSPEIDRAARTGHLPDLEFPEAERLLSRLEELVRH